MKIFVSGGCKNGKSYYAQRLAKAQSASFLYYIATMRPADGEDDRRIIRHKAEREGWGFITIEQAENIEHILHKSDAAGSFLLDSATALLANEMFTEDGSVNENAAGKIIDGFSQILQSVQNIVIVSDYIYSDAMIYDDLTEKYRKNLASIDKYLAQTSDAVLEISYTNTIIHKGGEAFEALLKTLA